MTEHVIPTGPDLSQFTEELNFRDFEKLGWEQAARPYHRGFSQLTPLTAQALVREASIGPRQRVLDVATGPGYAAAAASLRGASVLGLDIAEAVVALARTENPGLEIRLGDAECLELPDNSFDAVLMNFVLMHLADPDRALREAHRVLKPGGKIAFSAWAKGPAALAFELVRSAVEKHGQPAVALPAGPDFFRFSDVGENLRSLAQTGFKDVASGIFEQFWRVGDPDEVFQTLIQGTVRTGALLRAQSPASLMNIRREIGEEVARYKVGQDFLLPMSAVIAVGIKQG